MAAEVDIGDQRCPFSPTVADLFVIQNTALHVYADQFAARLRNGTLSEDCIVDIVKLGITPDQWAEALNNVSINNGVGSTVALYTTLPEGSAERRVSIERNLTVGQKFLNGYDSGTVAWASVNDSLVWINPYLVNPGDFVAASGLIAHETLRNLKLPDPDIQTRLGIPVTDITRNIGVKLGADCFK